MRREMIIYGLVLLTTLQISTAVDTPDIKVLARQSKLGLGGLGVNTIAQLAQDLLSRSTTSSQVLSLNLTNLVILLVVKALIFGAGSLGFGGGGHDALGRSVDSENTLDGSAGKSDLITESEVMLMLSYMQGAITDDFDCLNAVACQDPRKAKEYFTASSYLVKGANMFDLTKNKDKYEKILTQVDEAIRYGAKGYECGTRYKCKSKA